MEQEQKKSILIIKANPQSLLAAEGFLRNRDWKIKATSNLKEALVYLVQEQPAFVMISMDHPNKKVQKLPKVLASAFPVCVIAFAEESITASYKALNNAATEYQIYPPITGPAIERIVNKYYKDQLTKPTMTAAQRAAGEIGDGDSTINIKGSNGFNAANAQNLLAQMLAGDGADLNLGDAGNIASGNMSGSSSANGSSSMMMPPSHSDPKTNANSSAMHGKSGKGGPTESAFEQMNADSERRLAEKIKSAAYVPTEQKPGAQGNAAAYAPPGSQAANSGSAAPLQEGSTKGTSKGHLQKGAGFGNIDLAKEGSGTHGKAASEDGAKSGLSNHFNRTNKNNGPTWEPAPGFKEKNKQRPKPESDDGGKDAERDSLMLRGTTAALEKSCIQLSKTHNQSVDVVSNMACLVIESTRFSGYLITAMGKNKVIDDAFLNKIQLRLSNFLKEHGEKLTHGESMQLNLKQVPFMPWAVEQAEFLRKSSHMGDEVAMAFFPRAEIRANFGESADEEMAAVQLQEFAGDTTVDFNVYIYLPKNSKYVLYTPRGGVFYGRQKDRLSGQGISHLHVLKAEMKDLDKYRAENYLNDSIEDFANKDRGTKKSA
jgi:hypothetical protein